jgi:UDP-GlcNAc:undecaprenyl-phosphate GlcNAc-1-phosphate transferase
LDSQNLLLLVTISTALAFLLNLGITPFILYLSHRFGWYDQLDSRKIHTEDTPRLGGVGFFASFILSAALLSIVLPRFFPEFRTSQLWSNRNILMFAGFMLVHLIGIYDDFRNIRAIYKLTGQIIAGAMVAIGGALMDGIYIPFLEVVIPLGPMSGAVTIFWLISISNAVNFIDGLDGLAGGTSLIAAIALGTVHVIMGNIVGALMSYILAGALLAFLIFNKPVAKIFMGDSGSLFLGFILGALAFVGVDGGESAAPETLSGMNQFSAGFVLTVTVLFVPIVDMISAILRRIREGRPIHHPDKKHLHHKLLSLGFSNWQILGMVHGLNLLYAVAVIFWAIIIAGGSSPFPANFILLLSWALGAGLFTGLHYYHKSRQE